MDSNMGEKAKITFSVFHSQSHFPRMIRVIRENHLYVRGWLMSDWMHNPEHILLIIVCKYNNKPVAVGMLHEKGWAGCPNVGIFVKPAYRNKGIGTKIINKIANAGLPLKVAYGNVASQSFYSRLKAKLELNIVY